MTEPRFGRLTDPPATLLIRGARVIDPSTGEDRVRDVGVHDGVVVHAARLPMGAEEIDARGWIATPGLCDIHAHLREPGSDASETVASGSRAAAHGGFTTVAAMPNTDPPLDTPARVTAALDAGRDAACRVRVIAAATIGRAGEETVDVHGLVDAGAVGLSDDGSAVRHAEAVHLLLRELAGVRPLIEHAEDATLAGGAVMRQGPWASRLGLPDWPPEAEVRLVERDLALAEETGGWVHFTHLSTSRALHAVREARARGVRVTCDVTPHHIALTDAWVAGSRRFSWDDPGDDRLDPTLAYDGLCRVNPPLASRSDALALLAGVADATVDAIATDHAPHPSHRKAVPFGDAAPGLIGLETALSLGMAAVEAGRIGLSTLLGALNVGPARLIGEDRGLRPGMAGDLVLVDPSARWRVERDALASASANTPLLGMELPAVVHLTVANGRVTYRA